MLDTTAKLLEEKLLGNPQDTPLQSRIFNAIALLICFMSALTTLSNGILLSLEEAITAAIATTISGSLYLYSRKTKRLERLILPGCLAFVGLLAFDWVLDPAECFSSDGYYFFMLAIVAAIVLSKRQATLILILIFLVVGVIFFRDFLHPGGIALDKKTHLSRVADNALTLIMSLCVTATIVRIVIREHIHAKKAYKAALEEIKTLQGLLPICARCKSIRDRSGYWNKLEEYIETHSEAEFTHGFCPKCLKELYGDLMTDSNPSSLNIKPENIEQKLISPDL